MAKPEVKKGIKKIVKKRAKSPVLSGNIYIQSTFNNTMITITDEKGGAILSVAYAIKKPILFLGTGQGYQDFKMFDPKEFVRGLLE